MSPVAATPALLAPGDVPMEENTRLPVKQTIETFLSGVEHRAYRFALYELRDRDAALDAVQDSMWRLVERYAERPAAEWPALFFAILRNRTTDTKRWRLAQQLRGLLSNRRRRDDDSEDEWLNVPASEHEMPEAQRIAAEQRVALERALAQLPTRQRQVFLLREWQGMTTAETAQALGCTEGTVKQHHFRALQTLRAKLSEVWHEHA
ncbi:MAG: RNA polymerase sigma factor [Sulfurifustis sp.]